MFSGSVLLNLYNSCVMFCRLLFKLTDKLLKQSDDSEMISSLLLYSNNALCLVNHDNRTRDMLLNATFNSILVISWRSVLLVAI
jgi:hypothetical protein